MRHRWTFSFATAAAPVNAQPIHNVGRSRNHADMRARSGRRGLLETALERVEYQPFDEADAWRASDMEAYRQNPRARRRSFFSSTCRPRN